MIENETSSASSVGFIGGIIFGSVFVLFSALWLWFRSRRGNDELLFVGSIEARYPKAVLIWRLAAFSLGIAAMVVSYSRSGAKVLYYYTHWNWILVTVYFLFGLILSVIRVRSPEYLKRGADPNHIVTKSYFYFQLLGELETPSSLFVGVVFWTLLANGIGDFVNVSMHLCNFLMMITDFFLADYLFNSSHWVLALFLPSAYVLYHLVINRLANQLSYSFLDTDKPLYIGWILGLALGMTLLFFGFRFGGNYLKKRFLLVMPADEPASKVAGTQV